MKRTLGERIAEHNQAVADGEYAVQPGTRVTFTRGSTVLVAPKLCAEVSLAADSTAATCFRCGDPLEAVSAHVKWRDDSGRTSMICHVGCVPWQELPGRPWPRNPPADLHMASPGKAQRQKLASAIIAGEVPLRLSGPTAERFKAPGDCVDGTVSMPEENYAAHLDRIAKETPRISSLAQPRSLAQHRSLMAVWQQCHAAGVVAKS